MAFGLTSAPATFQRLMTTVLVDLIAKEKAICYVDDILLADSTFKEHLNTLDFCFKRLVACGLKLKLSKAAFCRRELNYLGHTITDQGVKPAKENVDKLKLSVAKGCKGNYESTGTSLILQKTYCTVFKDCCTNHGFVKKEVTAEICMDIRSRESNEDVD